MHAMLSSRRTLSTVLAILMVALMATSALAYSSWFTSRCASCHNDDTATCAGCHEHRGNISAAADMDSYAPGDPLTITLSRIGGRTGWIRAILYNQDGDQVGIASGPTGTGDDSAGSPVTFPVQLTATAPSAPGDYTWEAAWYGSNNSGTAHIEDRTPVTVRVEEDVTGVPDFGEVRTSWSAIKSLF